jgi:hypothetical protein
LALGVVQILLHYLLYENGTLEDSLPVTLYQQPNLQSILKEFYTIQIIYISRRALLSFVKNQLSDSHPLPKHVSEFRLYISYFVAYLGEIRYKIFTCVSFKQE